MVNSFERQVEYVGLCRTSMRRDSQPGIYWKIYLRELLQSQEDEACVEKYGFGSRCGG